MNAPMVRNRGLEEFVRVACRHEWRVSEQRPNSVEVTRINGRRTDRIAAHFETTGMLRIAHYSQWPHMGRSDVPAAPVTFEVVTGVPRLAELLREPAKGSW